MRNSQVELKKAEIGLMPMSAEIGLIPMDLTLVDTSQKITH